MRVYLRTFGCRANHYDTEMVRAMIEGAGHRVVASAAEADLAVFNGCAVTAEAERELRKSIRHAARERAELRTIVMGCAAASPDPASTRQLRSLPTVERLVPGADPLALADALELPAGAAVLRQGQQTSVRALLRIQDGCDEHCTFCATTLARGASRSRSVREIVAEATRLAWRHPEIVLTGIHIGAFGVDIGTSLGALVETLVAEVSGVRFRLSSLEATEVDERLFELLTADPTRIAPHLHAPLQSGSDRLLRRMGRHWYTADRYVAAIERLAGRCRVFGVGADLIAGFPGETDEDHAATLALLERLPLTYAHVFPFSLRPGTAAERLNGRVAPEVASLRARELRQVADRKSRAYRAMRAGGEGDVVVVRGGGDHAAREGVTEDYLTVLPRDSALPRGTRFRATLTLENDHLVADALP